MQIFLNIFTAALILGIVAAVIGAVLGALGRTEEKKEEVRIKKSAKKDTGLRAFVKCSGSECEKKYTYADANDCFVANLISEGPNACSYSCIGLGSCIKVCPENAISIDSGIAVVSANNCTGCGLCAEICPRGTIELVPADRIYKVQCQNRDADSESGTICEDGCIGCFACVNTCECGAITVEENLAVIDYEKCTSCGLCAEVCPRGCITAPEKEVQEESFDESEYFSIELAEEN